VREAVRIRPGNFLVNANYASGSVAVLPIGADGDRSRNRSGAGVVGRARHGPRTTVRAD